MRNTLIALAFVAPLALAPATASAQDSGTGAAVGATTGAVGGAIVGGPVGAAVGAVGGAVVGGATGAANERRVYVTPPPAVVERECVENADGSRTCVESRR